MSADYLNFIVPLEPRAARRHFEALSAAQRCSDLVGPDEETLRPVRSGEPLDAKAVARSYGGRLPAPPDYGRAWVNVDPGQWLEVFDRESPEFKCLLSIGEPVLSTVDRVLALPRGVALLEGQAAARFRPQRRARTYAAWSRMLSKIGGSKKAAELLKPYLSRGAELASVARILDEIKNGLAWKDERQTDVLMFVTPT
jgi:hypothetical protein